MGPEIIIIARVGLHDVVKMLEAEAEEVIERFAFQGSDPCGGAEKVGVDAQSEQHSEVDDQRRAASRS